MPRFSATIVYDQRAYIIDILSIERLSRAGLSEHPRWRTCIPGNPRSFQGLNGLFGRGRHFGSLLGTVSGRRPRTGRRPVLGSAAGSWRTRSNGAETQERFLSARADPLRGARGKKKSARCARNDVLGVGREYGEGTAGGGAGGGGSG